MKSLLLISANEKKREHIRQSGSGNCQITMEASLQDYLKNKKRHNQDLVFMDLDLITEILANPSIDLESDAFPTLSQVRKQTIELIEEAYLICALIIYSGRINKTSEAIGISSRQIHKLMTKYDIHKEDFRRKRNENKI